MMKKLVALSLVAMLSANAVATNVETKNLKETAEKVAKQAADLKAAGYSDEAVMNVMSEVINQTGDTTAAPAVVKNNKKILMYVVGGVLGAAALGYAGYKVYRYYYPVTTPAAAPAAPAANTPAAPATATTTAAPAPVTATTTAAPVTATTTAAPVTATTTAAPVTATTTAAPVTTPARS